MAYEPNWDAKAREEFNAKQVLPWFFISDDPNICTVNNYQKEVTGIRRETIENE